MTRGPGADLARSAASILAVVAVGVGLALAGSDRGARVGGVPVFALAVAVTFAIQWAVFVPSFLRQTERSSTSLGA